MKKNKKSFDQLIQDAGITRTGVAAAADITTQTLRNKLKDPGSFLVREVARISECLKVEIPVILEALSEIDEI